MTDLDRTLDALDAAYDAERRDFWEAKPASPSSDTWLLTCDACGLIFEDTPDGWTWEFDGLGDIVRCPDCSLPEATIAGDDGRPVVIAQTRRIDLEG